MFGIDWNGDGKETLFDDMMTAELIFGEDEDKEEKDFNFDFDDDEDDDF
jgi:hypothetical protein